MSVSPASVDHIADIGNAFQKLESLKPKEESQVLKAIKKNHAIKLDVSPEKSIVIKVTDENRDKVLQKLQDNPGSNKEHLVLKFVLEEVKNQNVVFKVKEKGQQETIIFFSATQKELYETKKMKKLESEDAKAQFRSSVKITQLKDEQKDEISKAVSRALINVSKLQEPINESESSRSEEKTESTKNKEVLYSNANTVEVPSEAQNSSQMVATGQVIENKESSSSQQDRKSEEAIRKQDQARQDSAKAEEKRADIKRTEEQRSDARQEAVDQGEVGGSKAEDRKQEDIKTELASEDVT